MSWLVTQINLLSRAEPYRQTKMQYHCNVIKVHGYTYMVLLLMVIRDIPYWCLFLCYSEPKYLNEMFVFCPHSLSDTHQLKLLILFHVVFISRSQHHCFSQGHWL